MRWHLWKCRILEWFADITLCIHAYKPRSSKIQVGILYVYDESQIVSGINKLCGRHSFYHLNYTYQANDESTDQMVDKKFQLGIYGTKNNGYFQIDLKYGQLGSCLKMSHDANASIPRHGGKHKTQTTSGPTLFG